MPFELVSPFEGVSSSPEIVAALKAALTRAEAGETTGLFLVEGCRDGKPYMTRAGEVGASIVGAVETLKFCVLVDGNRDVLASGGDL
jgi:hypothetical protein